ncbi:MAG: aminotransferase class V-fold PLP-dependent enzyme [Bacteroidota bacterium]
MISFYPGPSRVDENIPRYVQEAYDTGILSINHRSDEFMELAKDTVTELKAKLNIPENYSIFFVSSSTECWEIMAQSLIKNGSHHFYNGAFGEKWLMYTEKIRSNAIGHRFEMNDKLKTAELKLTPDTDTICITQNETSNGTQVHNYQIEELRAKFPDQIIAVDATSSMAGIDLDFKNADFWYASVQKCFGLPAGLAVVACSPRALEKALEVNDISRYNSMPSIIKMMQKYQTTHTPNVMGIYLLNRVMQDRKNIRFIDQEIRNRYSMFLTLLDEVGLKPLIENKEVQSYTVLPVSSDPNTISKLKMEAQKEGLILGNGYGNLKETTFRIANFPSIKMDEITLLKNFLLTHR